MIKIDVNRLALRLWLSQGRSMSEVELRQWLEQTGFKWSTGQWYFNAGDLGQLKPDEILQRQVLERSNGVTFIDNDPGETPPTQTR